MAGRSRLIPTIGVAITAAGGYYLYSAGGNPKVAEKQFEHDAASASARLKSSLPGSGKEAQKASEEWASQIGSKIDHTISDAKAGLHNADAKAEAEMRKADAKIGQLKAEGIKTFEEVKKEAKRDIDAFDAKVEKKAAEAKNGVWSWLGLGK